MQLPKILALATLVMTSLPASADLQGHESAAVALKEVRDPVFNQIQRHEVLRFAQKKMQEKLSQDMKVPQEKLIEAFTGGNDSLALVFRPDWKDVQTQFFVTLHQDALQTKWRDLRTTHMFSSYGTNLAEKMIAHLGNYDPGAEGMAYLRWYNVEKTVGGKKVNYRVPLFLKPGQMYQLTREDPNVPFEGLFPSVENASAMRPTLDTFMKNAPKLERKTMQELAEKVVLNQRIYYRAVANSAKTVASLSYLTGEQNRAQSEAEVGKYIQRYCEGCNAREKGEFLAGAMHYVDQIRKDQKEKTVPEITQGLCKVLRDKGYVFPAEREAMKPKYAPNTMAGDMINVQGNVDKLVKQKRMSAIQEAVFNQTLGVLLVTEALVKTNAMKEGVQVTLLCTSQSLAEDVGRVKSAIKEAKSNLQTYIKKVNDRVSGSQFDEKSVDGTLEYFAQTNVAASAEAVMTFPQGMDHVMGAVRALDKDDKKRKKIDKVVAWGGTIIGVGLTISGAGSFIGVPMILSIAATKGVVYGTYYLIRTQQEKRFAAELFAAKKGLGANFLIDEQFYGHYKEYCSLKLRYIMEFSGSLMAFTRLHSEVINNSKNIKLGYQAMRKAFSIVAKMGTGKTSAGAHKAILDSVYGELK